jgi:hypothetical protein
MLCTCRDTLGKIKIIGNEITPDQNLNPSNFFYVPISAKLKCLFDERKSDNSIEFKKSFI